MSKQHAIPAREALQNVRRITGDPAARKLNLACGEDIRPPDLNWVNVDVVEVPGVSHMDVYALPWNLGDASFDYVLASHILEHIPFHVPEYGHRRNFMVMFMEEIWRVLKPGGMLEIIVPGGIASIANAIDHKRIVTANTFHIFYPHDKWDYYTDRRFELLAEIRHEPRRFRFAQWLFRKAFGMEIEHLGRANRTIILRKLASGGANGQS